MESPDIAVVRSLYAAFGRGDIPAILGALSPDVTWGVVGRPADYPTFGIVPGRRPSRTSSGPPARATRSCSS